MKKTRKGATLVEVIVSIAVFTIISLAMFSSYIGMRQIVYRQEEYTRIEMICYDINYHWDRYGDDWGKEYFKDDIVAENGIYTGYLDKDFKPQTSGTNARYSIQYKYEDEDEVDNLIIVSIKSIDGERVYIENVKCGESVAEVTNNEEQQN